VAIDGKTISSNLPIIIVHVGFSRKSYSLVFVLVFVKVFKKTSYTSREDAILVDDVIPLATSLFTPTQLTTTSVSCSAYKQLFVQFELAGRCCLDFLKEGSLELSM